MTLFSDQYLTAKPRGRYGSRGCVKRSLRILGALVSFRLKNINSKTPDLPPHNSKA